MMEKECEWCGKPYQTIRPQQTTCCKECREARLKKLGGIYRQRRRERQIKNEIEEATKKLPKKKKLTLSDCGKELKYFNETHDCWLTYGEYEAKIGFGTNPPPKGYEKYKKRGILKGEAKNERPQNKEV